MVSIEDVRTTHHRAAFSTALDKLHGRGLVSRSTTRFIRLAASVSGPGRRTDGVTA